jgi:hypothetical protein
MSLVVNDDGMKDVTYGILDGLAGNVAGVSGFSLWILGPYISVNLPGSPRSCQSAHTLSRNV